jgi:hypothetical protein
MSSEVFEGGCLCGEVRYRATAAPQRGVICHCSMCRRHSGAPALAFAVFPKASFRWSREPSWFRSSPGAQRGYCPKCGSTLAMHEDHLPQLAQVCVGTLDEPQRVRIDDHVFASERVPWFDIKDSVPRYAKSSPEDGASPQRS